MDDFYAAVDMPGFTFTPTHYNAPVYTIRGIGFYETTLSATPAVTVYTDQVPLPFAVMTRGAAIDLERVEILKGPQGTLFGQNSTGGAVNYVAAKPTDHWTAGFGVGFGRFATSDVNGYVSGPLSDTVSVRVAGKGMLGGGWQRSYTRDDKNGKVEQFQGRVLLDWKPSDRLTFSASLSGWVDRSDVLAGQLVAIQPQVPAGMFPEVTDYPLAPAKPRAADWTPGFNDRDEDFYQTSLRGDLAFGFGTLTSITSYAHYTNRSENDFDAIALKNPDSTLAGNVSAFTQELRLGGTIAPVVYVFGGNYEFDKSYDTQSNDAPYSSNAELIPGKPFWVVGNFTRQRVNTYAAFGNVEVSITDTLTLQSGIRYTKSSRSFSGCTFGDPNLAATFEVLQQLFKNGSYIPIAPGECATLNQLTFDPGLTTARLSEDNISWRQGVNWQATPDTLIYANVSRGYKSGSFPTLSAAFSAQYLPVTQESVLAYEAGVKAGLFDRRLQVNLAGFYYDYKNKQVRGKFDAPPFGAIEGLLNVPKSRIWGIEGQINASPVEGLELSIGGTYLNAKVKEFFGLGSSGIVGDFAGNILPYSPKFTGIADAQYRWPIGNGLEFEIGGSVNHSSSTHSSLGNEALFANKAYTLVDARMGIGSEGGNWKLSAWAHNIFNEYYWTNTIRGIDTVYRYAGKPSTYGITFTKRFD